MVRDVIGWCRGRKELLSVSSAVPLESSLVDRRLQQKKTWQLTFYFNFIYSFLIVSSPQARCNLWTSPQVYSCIWKEPGVSAQRRKAEKLFWQMELIVVHLFWLCYPQVSLGLVRLCSSSTLKFGDLYPTSLRGNTEGGFCQASELFLQSRGFKSSFGGAPGEARVKERNSCGHSLYSQTFFLGLHNEQRKT